MKRVLGLAILVFAGTAIFLLLRSPQANRAVAEIAVPVAREQLHVGTTARPLRPATAVVAPHTIAPSSNLVAAPTTNLIQRLLKQGGEPPHISREQVEAFLAANGRRAESLLAAWRASGDKELLREAMEKFPNDPHVAFMAWSRNGGVEDPELAKQARREWIDKFKQAAPQNALADYLSANALFKEGDQAGAMRELAAAEQKQWRDYTKEGIQNVEEAYRSAGFSEAEAKLIASMSAPLPHLTELRGVGKSLNEISATYRQAGDAASAEAAVQWALQVGQRAGSEGSMTLIQELVGFAIQRDALKGYSMEATIGDSPLTVQQRLESLEQRRNEIRSIARESGALMDSLSEAELSAYFDRTKLFGEEAAVQWARARKETK